MGIEINKIARKLHKEEGIWYSNESKNISYAKQGNQLCYEIEDNSFWFEHRNNIIGTVVNRYKPKGAIIDIGGGNGFVTKHIQSMGFETILLEPGQDGVTNAAERGVKSIINSDFERAGFIDNSIDAACLFDVLEHIKDPIYFLHSLNDALKEDAILYITVPAYKFLWSDEDVIAGHYTRYTKKRIKKLLKEAGFLVEYCTYFFSGLVLPIFMSRTLPSLLKYKKKNDTEPNVSIHKAKQNFIHKMINKIWKKEVEKIKAGKNIYFGSSIIIICKNK